MLLRPTELQAGDCLHRHSHARPYATLVLEGGYHEAGDAGRVNAAPGHVLFHGPFSAHWDSIADSRTIVLDLPLPFDAADMPAWATAGDPDVIVRLAENDPSAASRLLVETATGCSEGSAEPPDLLADALRSNCPPQISQWARTHGMSREHISRQFQAAYHVTPVRFRMEAQSRRAWRMIIEGSRPLACVAAEAGYADQAHMTRSIGLLTGKSPQQWRAWARRRSGDAAQSVRTKTAEHHIFSRR